MNRACLPAGTLGVDVVESVYVLHDRKAGRSECVGQEKRAGIGPVRRDARDRELVVVIGRKSASHDGASRRKMNRQLVCDRRMLNIRDALWSEQRGENVTVLAGLARRERGKRSDRQAQVEADAVEVARTDSGTGQDQHAMLRKKPSQFLHDRKYCFRAAIHDGAATYLYDLQPGEEPDRTPACHGTGEVVVEEGLTRQRRGDVFDGVGEIGHGPGSLARGDDGADVLTSERAGQVARDETIDDLNLPNVARCLEQVEHRELEDGIVQPLRLHLVD